ncbi:hypothetical protein [uncultured Methylobacterium sp.]|uniref:hypothetical protein n=1 Tax=uncultured Methylobacterium sp. TaxID=157278 RepID=UPI0026032EE1|nr:hypothetical protein [uncultured Methylobacterium sp.]
MSTAPTTLPRQALIQVLTTIQNSPRYQHQDIMTMAGLCSTPELVDHVWRNFRGLPAEQRGPALEHLRAVSTPLAA